MYCPQCGTFNKDGVNFCMKCGHSFKPAQQSSKIIITREKKSIGSIQNHEIYLNGNYIGVLKNGGTLEIPVEYGTHRVEFKSSMKSMGQSSKVTVHISEENPVTNVYAGFEMNGNFEIAGAKKDSNTNANSNVVNDIKYKIKGLNGQLYVYENKIEITRKGVWAFAHQGLKGTKTIPISAIKTIQVKKTGLTQGYIQFGVLGGVENRGGLQAANYDENTVTFGNASDNKTATQIKEYIESLIYNNSNSRGNVVQATSDADELLKFKKLLDDGVITQEEFDAKKKQLLGL